MILERLVLENFRQFRGRQELVFSDIRERNITIIHAENGFGKTTLLKALLWALYGQDGLMGKDGQPEDFEKHTDLLHEGTAATATDPNAVTALVELTFKHDEDRYILRRSLTLAQQRHDARKTDLSLEQMRDGQTYRQDNPQNRIQAIVPEGIRRLLFFNGERIDYLALEQSRAEVTEAIHQMLGLRLLQATVGDLNHVNVKGKLRSDLKEQPTSDQKRNLLDEREKAEDELAHQKERVGQIGNNLIALASEVTAIDAKLSANRDAHELQNRRILLNKELEELKRRKEEADKRLSKLIAEDGYMLFTPDLVTRGREIVQRLRSEGKIPAKVLNSFLQELIDAERCICSRCLEPGSEERKAVEELLTIAGDADFNNAVGALDHTMGILDQGAKTTETQIRQLNTERLELKREMSNREEEVEDIHQKIGSKEDDTVKELEDKRQKLLLDRESQIADQGRTEGEAERLEAQVTALGEQIRQMEDKDATAALAQRRVDAVEDCVELLEDILKAETEDLRPLLNEEIKKHFSKIMDRDLWPELTDDFTLRIRKRIAGAVVDGEEQEIDAALSTGQRTVTSLVFIASLVALAERRSEIPTILKGLSGSAFPIVVDSPFGSLSLFREAVARYLPELAPQVILLVSPSQYDGQVEKALNEVGRIGKRYYLKFTGPTLRDDAAPDLVIGGETIQQYASSDQEEFTEICEL